jgi:hypothetical protein
MRTVHAACTGLVDQLRAAGFGGSSIDPEQLNPPGAVWVQPRTITGHTLAGGATLTVWLYLLAPNVETEHAMTLLDDSLAGVLDLGLALADDDAIDLTAAVLLPGNSTPLPAYRLAVDLDL